MVLIKIKYTIEHETAVRPFIVVAMVNDVFYPGYTARQGVVEL